MMKQKLFLTLAILLASIMCVNAQAAIGSNNDYHSSIVPDLQSEGKNFFQPHVFLLNVADFRLNSERDDTKREIIGMGDVSELTSVSNAI